MRSRTIAFLLLISWAVSGCGAAATSTPTGTPVIVFPTLGPLATATPTLTTIMGMSCPNPDCVFLTPSSVGTAEPLRFDLPTPGREPISAWRPPQYSVPLALGPFDHFYFARPIGADQINWPIADYRYGGTFLGKDITHTGVDIPAKAGTPVLAAGPGTVVWAGWGLFGSSPGDLQDPYGIAVAIRHDFGYQGQPLFTVYAHMSKVTVTAGEWVNTGTQLGNVGSTGATTGPHLHFEVRLGENSYFYTRNPELWVAPPQGWGVLAGRIMHNDTKLVTSTAVAIEALVGAKHEWLVNTYGPGPAIPDAYYNENMVISDLPAGDYLIRVTVDGQPYQLQVTVFPGRVTYFSLRGVYGFSTKPPPIPAIFTATPTPAR